MLPQAIVIHPDDFKEMLRKVVQAEHTRRDWFRDTFWSGAIEEYCERGNLHALKHIQNELGNGINFKNSDGSYDTTFLSKTLSQSPYPIVAIWKTYRDKCVFYHGHPHGWTAIPSDHIFTADGFYRMIVLPDCRTPKKIAIAPVEPIVDIHSPRNGLDGIEV